MVNQIELGGAHSQTSLDLLRRAIEDKKLPEKSEHLLIFLKAGVYGTLSALESITNIAVTIFKMVTLPCSGEFCKLKRFLFRLIDLVILTPLDILAHAIALVIRVTTALLGLFSPRIAAFSTMIAVVSTMLVPAFLRDPLWIKLRPWEDREATEVKSIKPKTAIEYLGMTRALALRDTKQLTQTVTDLTEELTEFLISVIYSDYFTAVKVEDGDSPEIKTLMASFQSIKESRKAVDHILSLIKETDINILLELYPRVHTARFGCENSRKTTCPYTDRFDRKRATPAIDSLINKYQGLVAVKGFGSVKVYTGKPEATAAPTSQG